jgi:hypothetical protein
MDPPRLQRISNAAGHTWCVSYAGMERHFTEDWRAIDFYYSLLGLPSNPASISCAKVALSGGAEQLSGGAERCG